MNVAIIDAVSNGVELVRVLRDWGVRCLHVRTPAMRYLLARRRLAAPPEGWSAASFDYEAGAESALIHWARQQGVSRVLAGSEPGVELSAVLARALGQPGNDPALGAALRDKHAMDRTLALAGIRSPGGVLVEDPQQAVRTWRTELRGAPVVVKPRRSSAGDGVTFCADASAVQEAVARLVGTRDLFGAANHQVLIQRELQGRLYEVCTVSEAGQHEVVLIVETIKHAATYDAMRIVSAAEIPALASVVDLARRALGALGVREGAAHVEVLVGSEPPVVIEVAARLIGLLPPALCRTVLGTDQVTRLAEVTLGSGDLLPHASATGGRRFARVVVLCADRAGRIGDGLVRFESQLAQLPSTHRVVLGVAPGDRLEVTRDLALAPGWVELIGGRRTQVEADHAEIRRLEREGAWGTVLVEPENAAPQGAPRVPGPEQAT